MLRDVLTQKGLSNREAEVAELVVKGLSNKEVANQLFVTEKTVKFHLTNIYKKMNVKSRAQLIVWCMPYQNFVESNIQEPAIATQPAITNNIPVGNSPIAPNSVGVTEEPNLSSGSVNPFGMPVGNGNGNRGGTGNHGI